MSIVDTMRLRITSFFGKRNAPCKGASTFHKGIDIAAPKGTNVRSIAGGVVKKVGHLRGYGNIVIIDHGNGMESYYAHLNDFADIKEGQLINANQVIGQVGSTGVSTGNHLHFEIRKNGSAINPLAYLKNPSSMENKDVQYALAQQQYQRQNEMQSGLLSSMAMNPASPAPQIDATQSLTLTLAQQEDKGLLGNLLQGALSGGLGSSLLGTLLTATTQTKSQTLNLTLADLQQNGFSQQEIQNLISLNNQKKQISSDILSLNSHTITQEDMAMAGFSADKFNILSKLAESNQNKIG